MNILVIYWRIKCLLSLLFSYCSCSQFEHLRSKDPNNRFILWINNLCTPQHIYSGGPSSSWCCSPLSSLIPSSRRPSCPSGERSCFNLGMKFAIPFALSLSAIQYSLPRFLQHQHHHLGIHGSFRTWWCHKVSSSNNIPCQQSFSGN